MLLVRVPGDDTIVMRLRAELSSYRFRVVELPPARRAEVLAQLAEERDAQAALRAKPAAMAVEVYVRGAGARANEELVKAGPGWDATVLAVRVTEAMRARGLALPPLTAAGAAAADSVKPGAALGARGAARSSDDDDDVEPATPTELPPDAVGPSAPSRGPRRGGADSDAARSEGKGGAARADSERKANAERGDSERKGDAARGDGERTADAARSDGKSDAARGDGEREDEAARAESDATPIAGERRADAERRADRTAAQLKADAERKADEERRADSERKTAAERRAAAERKAAAQRKAEAERRAAAEREREREAEAAEDEARSVQASTARSRSALLYAEVGPTSVLSPRTNGLGPALDVFVSVKFRPYKTSSISLVGLIPLLSTDSKMDGTAIEVQTFGIGGFGDLHLPLGNLELNLGIGGMALLSSIFVDNPLYAPSESSQRLAALLGRVGASLPLTPDLRLGASIMVGLTVKELQLRMVDAQGNSTRPDVRWGAPLLFGMLSLELALPWDR